MMHQNESGFIFSDRSTETAVCMRYPSICSSCFVCVMCLMLLEAFSILNNSALLIYAWSDSWKMSESLSCWVISNEILRCCCFANASVTALPGKTCVVVAGGWSQNSSLFSRQKQLKHHLKVGHVSRVTLGHFCFFMTYCLCGKSPQAAKKHH